MWIMTSYEPLFSNHIKIPEIARRVEFNENGKANVTEQVADMLCSKVDHIEKCKTENKEEEEEEDDESEENDDSKIIEGSE